ncbi:MAG: hypothetical protein P8I82_07320 [Flavobacteriales bacterium]|nr:hypothetical protein [Flavobacteriales bacterium]
MKIIGFLGYLAIFGFSGYAQTNQSESSYKTNDIGLFPKSESPKLYTFKISGEYRFLGTYTHYKTLGITSENTEIDPGNYRANPTNNIFIGDDSQMPNLTLRISGRPSKKTSWGFDVYTYQFMEGDIKPQYGLKLKEINRPSIYDPISGERLASSLIVHLGINLYGSFDTNIGSFALQAGGIHWTSMSDLTLASYKGYNRFSLFERAPWDPIESSVEKRYFDFYKRGNISQDARWGEKPFTGLIVSGSNLPGGLTMKALVGKTDLYGGISKIPNIAYGGQIRKSTVGGFVGINTFNNHTYTDSLNQDAIGFNIVTLESHFSLAKFAAKMEMGVGRYIGPDSAPAKGWGEALHTKIKTPKLFDGKVSIETHLFRIAPEVINNNSIFMNSSIKDGTSTEDLNLPFASSMVSVGAMSNNRQGVNLNAEVELDELKLSLGIGSSTELEAISEIITYGHSVNGLTRSRIWRWAMGGEEPITADGPYERYSVAYRNVYETVKLQDTIPVKKSFSGFELQAKYHPKFFGQKLYLFALCKYSSVQKDWTPLPVFTEKAYVRQYSNELEAYYAFNSKLVLNGYLGIERTIANYDTEIDLKTKRPRNQFGNGYGLGIDYTIAKNTAVFLRHRWFSFEDKNFVRDQFKGTETILELKITF